MADFKIIMLLMQVIPGLVLIAVSIPLIRGKIGPNPGTASGSAGRWKTRRSGTRPTPTPGNP